MQQSRVKIFIDTEFTGLHKNTTLLSIGLVSECGRRFYAEFTDYDASQLDEWLFQNVIKHTRWLKRFVSRKDPVMAKAYYECEIETKCGVNCTLTTNQTEKLTDTQRLTQLGEGTTVWCIGSKDVIRDHLTLWMTNFEAVEIWSDTLAYDWVLFCDIWGHAFKIPTHIFYIPQDISLLFTLVMGDSDASRVGILSSVPDGEMHNSLFDAEVIRLCYNALVSKLGVETRFSLFI